MIVLRFYFNVGDQPRLNTATFPMIQIGALMTIDDPKSQDKLTKLLNTSGFPFQLAVEAAIRSTSDHSPWKVEAREYPWDSTSGRGYIDLVLSHGNVFFAVECKRSRDATWMFLMPDVKQSNRSHARIRWADTEPHRPALAGWGDIQVYPESPEADFCVVRGQGETEAPLLERIASVVTASVEALSSDLLALNEQQKRTCIILPVIVTTAQLIVSAFDPLDLDLTSGELSSAQFSAVEHLRFRKSLAQISASDALEPERLKELSAESERTVFVVNASHFVNWLNTLQLNAPMRTSPWIFAREQANAMQT